MRHESPTSPRPSRMARSSGGSRGRCRSKGRGASPSASSAGHLFFSAAAGVGSEGR
jgi:hypothetical protein